MVLLATDIYIGAQKRKKSLYLLQVYMAHYESEDLSQLMN